MYRNARDFYVLNLYPTTLWNSLMSPSSFLVASLGYFLYSIMSIANTDSFTFSFPIWIPFISFFPLMSMVKTFKTMLNKSVKSGHLCLVLILEEMILAFHCLVWCYLWICHIWPTYFLERFCLFFFFFAPFIEAWPLMTIWQAYQCQPRREWWRTQMQKQ